MLLYWQANTLAPLSFTCAGGKHDTPRSETKDLLFMAIAVAIVAVFSHASQFSNPNFKRKM